jgi:hypothetical protein
MEPAKVVLSSSLAVRSASGLPCTHIFYLEKIEHSLSREAGDNTDWTDKHRYFSFCFAVKSV